jgi:hypothetical protein
MRAIIRIDVHDPKLEIRAFEDIKLVKRGFIYWQDQDPGRCHRGLWESTVTLSDDFFSAVIANPVPMDLQTYLSLSRAPMAMDIYAWLNWRFYTMRASGRSSVLIPWSRLQLQFPSAYPVDTTQGRLDFKKNFLRNLNTVLRKYEKAASHVSDVGKHLRLTPCEQHVPSVPARGKKQGKT